jgi:cyanophycinase
MDAEKGSQGPGALALVGSGEYTPAMRDTDLTLLEKAGGPGAARVVVLPTAAGNEHPSSPARWARMGVEHFTGLGARVEAAMILSRADAQDPRWLSLLGAADFFYFSGGDPGHVIDAMRDTAAWDAICRRYREGAVLAGCSAGAMAFGGWSPMFRGLRAGGPVEFVPALGIEPRVIVLPHFDRMGRFVPALLMNRLVDRVPRDVVMVGVDEDTALARLGAEGARWSVSGRQGVTVFDRSVPGGKTVYNAGQHLHLPF